MILIFATPEEARELLGLSTRQPEIIRPQTTGPCVHYDEDEDGHCAYPYDQPCPHLDNPEILCPVKDSLYAMREVALLREACEAEQVSGQCVYYDERSEEFGVNVEPCTYPYEGGCPHLDDEASCPVKDEWLAESERIEQDLAWAWGDDLPGFVSLTRDPYGGRDMAAEVADQVPRSDAALAPRDPQEQDADMAAVAPAQTYETAAPEWVEPEPDDGALHTYIVPVHEEEPPQDGAPPYAIRLPPLAKRKNAWTEEENWTVARVDGRGDVIKIYRAAFPDSARTDKAILSRWEKLHRDCREPLTLDTVGDTALVTQCDEDPVFTVPRPTYRPGDRVRIKHVLHRGQTGEIRRYFPATENYLVAIDGMPDMIVLRDEEMGAV